MTSPDTAPEYMVLFHTHGWDQHLSPQDMQAIMNRTMAWFEELQQAGKMRAAQPLVEQVVLVSKPHGRLIADGPFAESKENIGGYLMLTVTTLDEAVAIAREWPMLDCGCTAEVRPVAPECPSFKRHREALQAQQP